MANYVQINENSKRVYINPNFQRNKPVPQSRPMHINPKFSQYADVANSGNKPKVYVNPNFVKLNPPMAHNYITNHSVSSLSELSNGSNYQYSSTVPSTSLSTPMLFKTEPNINVVAKSRYCLVRQNTTTNSVVTQPATRILPKVVTTYKINKYKSVSMESVKKKIDNEESVQIRNETVINPQPINIKQKLASSRVFQSRFKLIKKSTMLTPIKMDTKSQSMRRLSLNTTKIRQKTRPKAKIRIDRRKFKKNNIPCPQFRKYGKCLRNDHGNCDFLHDKKHVFICRKFLKGICQDKHCLLSHEVTREKMPTCFFYLKGRCTKEDCPYLHVKLNEKTKICTDFLKGYCDRGDTCLYRHINICPDLADKGVCLRQTCSYPHRRDRKIKSINKCTKPKVKINVASTSSAPVANKAKAKDSEEKGKQENKKESDQRYYKVVDSSSPDIETIKPTRCKLGALPSFILL